MIVLRSEIPSNANKLSCRYALAIKEPGTDREIWKARLVIGGHKDIEKHIMVRSSTTVQQQSLRMLLALAAIFGWKIWTQDISQAFVKSAGELSREIYIKKFNDVRELNLRPDQAVKSLRQLYGLCDSGDHWDRDFDSFHKKILGLTPSPVDASLYDLVKDCTLQGLTARYVDDTISTGNAKFDDFSTQTSDFYDAKPRRTSLTSSRVSISRLMTRVLLSAWRNTSQN